ncbi:MAG: RNA pseudouridine synthase, partial [Bacteroidota bacterium]
MKKLAHQVEKWIDYKVLPEPLELPDHFTFPYYYEPHPLALLASQELQEYLLNQQVWQHDFGKPDSQELGALGKMFGVLVVQDATGRLGYLAAFSGKLADSYQHAHFVPPVYDLYQDAGFYQEGESAINALNQQVATLENEPAYAAAKKDYSRTEQAYREALAELKKNMKLAKTVRRQRRQAAQAALTAEQFSQLEEELSQESIAWRFRERDLKRDWQAR